MSDFRFCILGFVLGGIWLLAANLGIVWGNAYFTGELGYPTGMIMGGLGLLMVLGFILAFIYGPGMFGGGRAADADPELADGSASRYRRVQMAEPQVQADGRPGRVTPVGRPFWRNRETADRDPVPVEPRRAPERSAEIYPLHVDAQEARGSDVPAATVRAPEPAPVARRAEAAPSHGEPASNAPGTGRDRMPERANEPTPERQSDHATVTASPAARHDEVTERPTERSTPPATERPVDRAPAGHPATRPADAMQSRPGMPPRPFGDPQRPMPGQPPVPRGPAPRGRPAAILPPSMRPIITPETANAKRQRLADVEVGDEVPIWRRPGFRSRTDGFSGSAAGAMPPQSQGLGSRLRSHLGLSETPPADETPLAPPRPPQRDNRPRPERARAETVMPVGAQPVDARIAAASDTAIRADQSQRADAQLGQPSTAVEADGAAAAQPDMGRRTPAPLGRHTGLREAPVPAFEPEPVDVQPAPSEPVQTEALASSFETEREPDRVAPAQAVSAPSHEAEREPDTAATQAEPAAPVEDERTPDMTEPWRASERIEITRDVPPAVVLDAEAAQVESDPAPHGEQPAHEHAEPGREDVASAPVHDEDAPRHVETEAPTADLVAARGEVEATDGRHDPDDAPPTPDSAEPVVTHAPAVDARETADVREPAEPVPFAPVTVARSVEPEMAPVPVADVPSETEDETVAEFAEEPIAYVPPPPRKRRVPQPVRRTVDAEQNPRLADLVVQGTIKDRGRRGVVHASPEKLKSARAARAAKGEDGGGDYSAASEPPLTARRSA